MASQSEYDLVVRNAVIVDGTGGPPAEGDVAVRDGLIAAVGGHCGGSGAEEVDGRDLVLAPGFIDPHTHLDANLFWDADLTPSSSFGVTTVVTSNCGYGLAPVLADDAKAYVVAALSTVEQIPERSITAAVPFDWDDLPSYCARLDQLDVLINHAFQVGHVPLRAAVLGVPDAHTRRASPDEIAAMGGVLRQGLELGALGFSTDQVVGNPGPGGSELPGQVCGDDELLALAAVLGQGPGPGLFTMANAALLQGRAERVADLSWHRRLAETSGRPVVVGPIFGSHEDPGGAVAIMDLVVEGQRPAATVVPQISTRPFELWTRLDSPGLLVRSLPTWLAAVRSDGARGVRALAGDRAGREQLRREGSAMAASPVFSGRWEHVGVRYSHQPNVEGRDLASLSAERDLAPTDLLLDLALTDDFDTQVATVMRNGDDDEVASLVAHPAAMIGASDAGAHILANTDSCYAVWTLQHWVRERKALTLERAIAKLTGDQARLLGLGDRGLVRTGLAADLVLFDPDAIRTTGVRFVDDQPEGGRRLVTDATGLEMSMVNGVVATRQGTSTGTRSGRRLRPVA
ncbi:MAG TPA: amidohydrolase family protein [Acidimicrobiales bacterium]